MVHNLLDDLGVRMAGADLAFLDDLVAKGILGRKTKAGFFSYAEEGKAGRKGKGGGGKQLNQEVLTLLEAYRGKTTQMQLGTTVIQHRMAGRFINEALLCLQGVPLRCAPAPPKKARVHQPTRAAPGPCRWCHLIAVRWRHRRGVRYRLPAIPRRPLPLRGRRGLRRLRRSNEQARR